MKSGIINVLKPAGITSNAVLSQIKRILHPQKIGHLGTLDPSGVGVLLVCIGKATKLFDYYLNKDKQYKAIFVFGKETDTLDSEGTITNSNDKIVLESEILQVLPKLIGNVSQMPPKYSAKKIAGQKAYNLARNGVAFTLAPKNVTIYDIKLVSKIKTNTFLFDIKCSSGTYIRSIARDMAMLLNTFAYMPAIIRTKSGNFDIKDSIPISKIGEQSITPLENILKDRQKIFVNGKFYDKIVNGCAIKLNHIPQQNIVVYCNNQVMGIGDVIDGYLKIKTSLWEKND